MSFAREVMRESLVEHSGGMNVLGAATQAVVVEQWPRVSAAARSSRAPTLVRVWTAVGPSMRTDSRVISWCGLWHPAFWLSYCWFHAEDSENSPLDYRD